MGPCYDGQVERHAKAGDSTAQVHEHWGNNMRFAIAGVVGWVLIGTGLGHVHTNPSASASSLRITQLMFNAPAPTQAELDAGITNRGDFDFIELKNVGSGLADLSGLRFTDGVEFNFPSVNLEAGKVAVVVKDLLAFETRYGSTLLVLGEFNGNLSNSGEDIVLLDAAGVSIHDFRYDDNWYEITDAGGSSLEILDTEGDYNDSANWFPSPTRVGAPGFHPDSTVPEPSSLILAILGLLGLLGFARRRRRAT